MKYILLFLLSFPVMAEIAPPFLTDKVTIQREGSIVTVKAPGYCWWVNADQYEDIPTEPTPLIDVILANMSEARPCGWKPDWKVAKNPSCKKAPCSRPLYSPEYKTIGRVKVGVVCETDKIRSSIGGREWHFTKNEKDLRGLALCERLW